MNLYSNQELMIDDHCWIKVSEGAMLQSFINNTYYIKPYEMMNGSADNKSDPN